MLTVSNTPNFTPQADGVYVYVQPPQGAPFANIATNLAAIVGTADWGPVNVPQYWSTVAGLYSAFGVATSDPNSLAVEAINALEQNANFVGVRVTDGTDTAAVFDDADAASGLFGTFVLLYSGSRGTACVITRSAAATSTANKPTFRITVAFPNANPEVFDNIIGYVPGTNGFSAAAYKANVTAAINNGTSARAPSAFVLYVPGTSTASSITTPYTAALASAGTDGTTSITTATLLGMDGTTGRTGMYALRGTGFDTCILAGCYDPTAGPTLSTFVSSEIGFGLALVGSSGTDTPTAIANKQGDNVSTINLGVLVDWANIRDSQTGLVRLVSPLGHALGAVCAQPPEASPGNTPVDGFKSLLSVSTATGQPVSPTEAGLRAASGIMFISNQYPQSDGLYRLANGQNASSISGQDGVNYTRMTNYLVKSLFALLGPYVDELQSANANDPLRAAVTGTLNAFFKTLKNQKRIADFKVTSDTTNNTLSTVAAGFLNIQVLVQYLSAARFFVPTLQGGTTVAIVSANAVAA